jgi:hypothetical protein
LKAFRKLLRRLPFYGAIKSISHYPDYWYWKLRIHPGRTPHLLKQRAVRECARKFGLRVLIETGTYYGEMVAAVKNHFDRIDSIECDPALARRAARMFARHPKIRILEGASEQLIPELLQSLAEPALFWLDAGYYTWDNLPRNRQRLPTELAAILGHAVNRHVVLIDDASTLKFRAGDQKEPLNIAELQANLAAAFPDRLVEVKHDIVRITPLPSAA